MIFQSRYIREHYDDDTLEKIYLHGDGASWIRSGTSYLPKAVFVLDSFHLHKYILTATSHPGDSSDDARNMLKLVRYQKEELPMAAEAEEVKLYYSSAEINESEKNRWGDLRKYWETIQATVSCGTKKTADIRWHIWNL